MPLFCVCDLTVESSIPFPELPPTNGKKADLLFQLVPEDGRPAFSGEWLHCWGLPEGPPWLYLGRLGIDYLLRFPDLADFLISPTGSDIRCYTVSETPPETIRHLFLDQVIPLVLSHRGRLVLHASAVATPNGAVAFAGTSGAGKSTLAASFCREGFPLLADDCFLLEEKEGRLYAIPSYPGLRLWADTLAEFSWEEPGLAPVAHYTKKKRVAEESGMVQFCRQAVPVRRIYLLDPQEEPATIEQIRLASPPPRDALMELVKCAYRLDFQNRGSLREQFERLGCLADSSVLYRLTFPRNFALLPAVREVVLKDIGEE